MYQSNPYLIFAESFFPVSGVYFLCRISCRIFSPLWGDATFLFTSTAPKKPYWFYTALPFCRWDSPSYSCVTVLTQTVLPLLSLYITFSQSKTHFVEVYVIDFSPRRTHNCSQIKIQFSLRPSAFTVEKEEWEDKTAHTNTKRVAEL